MKRDTSIQKSFRREINLQTRSVIDKKSYTRKLKHKKGSSHDRAFIIEGVTFFTSFESLCGVVKCKTEAGYKTIKQDELSKRLQSAVSLKDTEFTALKKEIM